MISTNISEIAKFFNVNVQRDINSCSYNQGASAGKNIYLGQFDDPDLELVAFFHELGHILSSSVIKNRTYYLSKISSEGLAWELGLGIASEYGYDWDYDSKQMQYARQQLASYVNGEYDDLKEYYKCKK